MEQLGPRPHTVVSPTSDTGQCGGRLTVSLLAQRTLSRNLVSHSPGAQGPEMKVLAGRLLQGLQSSLSCLLQSWGPRPPLAHGCPNSSLCLHPHRAVLTCLPSFSKDTSPLSLATPHSRMGASQVALVVKNLPAKARDARDAGLIPGSGRSPGGGNGNPLQYSCLENPMD